ncbi:MAG TPA: membrane protein insertase YidC, partial [Vicinamibacteria bacterium]|nr:membrane protein insertase YidC [Vicinamibacteria bacterium]
MEEKRLLIAVALSLLVLTAYQLLFSPPPKPRPSPAAAAATSLPSPSPSLVPAPPPGTASPAPVTVAGAAQVADDKERRVEVQTPDLSVAFSNRGARLLSWRLLHFADPRGRPEEMVQAVVGGPRPLDLETGDPAVDARLKDALFKPSAESITLPGGSSELRFAYAEGDLEAEKTLHFEAQGYLVSVLAHARKAGRDLPVRLFWGPGIGNPTPAEMEVQGYHAPQAVYLGPGGVERIPAPKVGPTQSVSPVRWAGVEGTHFTALWLPPPPGTAELRGIALPPGEDGKPRMGVQVGVGLGGDAPAMLYVGPKDYLMLSKL